MKIFVEHELPRGLGKKSVATIFLGDDVSQADYNNTFLVSVSYDDNTVWLNDSFIGDIPIEEGLEKITLPDDLANALSEQLTHRTINGLSQNVKQRLRKLVLTHRQALTTPRTAAAENNLRQTLEQIQQCDT